MKNSNNKYLSGTLWNFLDIGIFFGPFLQKINEKSKSIQKLPKMAFSLIFVFWCIKQKWSKIQFYLLGHIFVIKFVHFPIDISDFSGGEVPSMCTLNEAKNSADPRKSLNLRA